MKLYDIESLSIGSLDKNTAEGQNGLKALDYAKSHYNDNFTLNYTVINVEGYKCIAHYKVDAHCKTDTNADLELDEIIYPFDKERLYPIQGLQLEYSFKRKW